MMRPGEKKKNAYIFDGVDLGRIRNRNEVRVIAHMRELLGQYPDFSPDVIAVQDIYALALNHLPARYAQEFSIVLKDPVTDADVREAVQKAIDTVLGNPTDKAEYKGPAR